MEEEMMLNMVPYTALSAAVGGEGSDSNRSNSNSPCGLSKKRHRQQDGIKPSARFKGVVLQPNGRWGAQIYSNHQRIWIGTFNSESDAAKAYDSAAVKLRSGDSHRNIPLTTQTSLEPDFQKPYSIDEVLVMLKDGSYETKLHEFMNSSEKQDRESGFGVNLFRGNVNDGSVKCQQLFQKELTPSDVGKLNRLVIPKKYAVKYFPKVSEAPLEEEDGGVIDDIQLPFVDRDMKLWKFRYCYWKSSQSYVFTRGWNRFVKDKKLKKNDVVTFYRCECREWFQNKPFYLIHVASNGDEDNRLDLQLGFSWNTNETGPSDRTIKLWQNKEEVIMEVTPPQQQPDEEKRPLIMEVAPPQQQPDEEKKAFRLFGVNIN
ncbi:hypothetical protein C5167_007067 [Papaver somniferum]|uniref:AP2/ERF and B3 domain-containing transcription factor n=1 Tax=Papaver somniferum TaxID=3469 RepID=A0A4Y7JIK9_PAPSO|nr:AP2/ERF and B3 domain-containing transcription factor At1g50680-like [Papaver somniferum]RZC59771.1 hypothetical protein C5167_007067 [Papaver somniferum]